MQSEKPETGQFYTDLLIQILWDTADHLGLQSSVFNRDIASLRRRVNNEGVAYLTDKLPSLGKALDKALSQETKLRIPDAFKRLQYGSTEIPVFLSLLWKLIFKVNGEIKVDDNDGADKRLYTRLKVNEALALNPDVYFITVAVRAIRQVCYLAYKLEYKYTDEKVEQVLQNFIDVESVLPQEEDVIDLSPRAYRALKNANLLVACVLKDLNPWDITPRHGPGAVASGEKQWEKMNFSHYFAELDAVYPYTDYLFYNYNHLHDELEKLENMCDQKQATAKVTLVPKDSRGPRLISMEPLEIQWIQQGLSRNIIREIEDNSDITRGYVNFSNQCINRDLALTSSFSQEFITLDMKEASDRVSIWLVRNLFPPPLFECLKACRSEYTQLPSGHCLRLKKFAPMGSACCFPVEALIFWALAVGSTVDILQVRDLNHLPDVYVYGDDIICRKADYERFKPVFEELFLQFNEDKCCVGRFFRESCGMDAFMGKDVTPLKLHTLWDEALSPQALLSYVSYVNHLRRVDRDYTHAADFVQRMIFEQFGPLPITDETSTYQLAIHQQGRSQEEVVKSLSHFRRRWNPAYLRYEWFLPIVVPRTFKYEQSSGWDKLMSVTPKGFDPFGFAEICSSGTFTIPHIVKMRWTWIPSDRLSVSLPH